MSSAGGSHQKAARAECSKCIVGGIHIKFFCQSASEIALDSDWNMWHVSHSLRKSHWKERQDKTQKMHMMMRLHQLDVIQRVTKFNEGSWMFQR